MYIYEILMLNITQIGWIKYWHNDGLCYHSINFRFDNGDVTTQY